jgi:BlaI family penicillinase repressor
MSRDLPIPTDAEMAILAILWNCGEATVRQVHETLSETKDSQYTTTLKLMQIMTVKGFVERDESSRSHIYRPRITADQMRQNAAGKLMDRLFEGSAQRLLVGALGARKPSKKTLSELRKLIDELEKGRKS